MRCKTRWQTPLALHSDRKVFERQWWWCEERVVRRGSFPLHPSLLRFAWEYSNTYGDVMHTCHCQKCKCFDELKLFAQRLGFSTNTDFSNDRVYILVAFLFPVISMHVQNCDVLYVSCCRHFVLWFLLMQCWLTHRLTDFSRLLHEQHLVLRLEFCCCSFVTVLAKISIWRSPRAKWIYFIFVVLHFSKVPFNIIHSFSHRSFEQFVALRVSNKTVCALCFFAHACYVIRPLSSLLVSPISLTCSEQKQLWSS